MARNDVFKVLASRIAATSLLLHDTSANGIEDIPVDVLLQAPLLPHPDHPQEAADKTIQETIVETIGKLGENITLRRAAVAAAEGVTAAYLHGGDGSTGKMGGLAAVQPRKVQAVDEAGSQALAKAARQVARQVVGFNPIYLNAEDVPADVLKAEANPEEYLATHVLNKQSFIMNPDQTVAEYVNKTVQDAGIADGAVVSGFVRWQVGEGIEKKENDFASEVQKAAQL